MIIKAESFTNCMTDMHALSVNLLMNIEIRVAR